MARKRAIQMQRGDVIAPFQGKAKTGLSKSEQKLGLNDTTEDPETLIIRS